MSKVRQVGRFQYPNASFFASYFEIHTNTFGTWRRIPCVTRTSHSAPTPTNSVAGARVAYVGCQVLGLECVLIAASAHELPALFMHLSEWPLAKAPMVALKDVAWISKYK